MDTPTEFLQLKASDLQSWRKTYDEVYDIAVENLRKCNVKWDEISPGVFAASAGSRYI
jgi:hypothetical protein